MQKAVEEGMVKMASHQKDAAQKEIELDDHNKKIQAANTAHSEAIGH